MIKPVCFILFTLLSFYNQVYARSSLFRQQLTTIEQLQAYFAKDNNPVIIMTEKELEPPFDTLLTQPLMTKAIIDHYHLTPITHAIYAIKNASNNTYYRVSELVIDSNKQRNNPTEALNKHEAVIVELAFIKINFNALPEGVTSAVENTGIPFGKLLLMNQIKIATKNRQYFKLKCSQKLVNLMRCTPNSSLYGRTNTIVHADNKEWLAQVIEILPNSAK